jgi:hypothetical protein
LKFIWATVGTPLTCATMPPRIGRILIAQGRDAADAPLTNTFGPANLSGFSRLGR